MNLFKNAPEIQFQTVQQLDLVKIEMLIVPDLMIKIAGFQSIGYYNYGIRAEHSSRTGFL
ncbi:MAG: hypothetical protein U0223_00480 [Nitrospira sp.]|nr:hypothetical protein [Nitrospira sp.]